MTTKTVIVVIFTLIYNLILTASFGLFSQQSSPTSSIGVPRELIIYPLTMTFYGLLILTKSSLTGNKIWNSFTKLFWFYGVACLPLFLMLIQLIMTTILQYSSITVYTGYGLGGLALILAVLASAVFAISVFSFVIPVIIQIIADYIQFKKVKIFQLAWLVIYNFVAWGVFLTILINGIKNSKIDTLSNNNSFLLGLIAFAVHLILLVIILIKKRSRC